MKKSILFVLCLGFFANLFATEFTFNLSERNIAVQNDNGVAKFDWSNAVSVDIPGDPALPVYVVDFILPDDADMDSVSVDIINDSADVLTGNFDVLPTAPIEPENSERYWPEHPENIDEHGRNRLIYGGNGINAYNGFLHNSWIEKVVKNKWKSVKFVKVFVRAYDWNPTTKELKKLTVGTLRVSFTSENNSITLSHFSPITAVSLGSLMQNTVNKGNIRIQNIIPMGNSGDFQPIYSFMQGVTAFNVLTATDVEPTLYIITTEDIRSKSKLFRHFIESKRHMGFAVHIVTEYKTTVYSRNSFAGGGTLHEGWDDNSNIATAEKIRNYLKHNNRYEEIDYLLLIGNPHPGSCNEVKETTGLSNDVIAELNANNLKSLSREKDCLYNGVDEGDIPMKWINLDAHSENEEEYCRGYDKNTKTCDGRWMKDTDLRRAVPSDIYYSALSKDWDSNKNGLIGDNKEEIGVISNDVILGRIPVYNNNIDDLDKYFQKVIRYENTLKTYVPNVLQNTDNIETLRHRIFVPVDYMDNHKDRDETPNWIFAEYLRDLQINHSFSFDFMLKGNNLMNWNYPIGYEGCQNKGTFKTLFSSDDGNNHCVVHKYYQQFFPSEFDSFQDKGLQWNNQNIADRWKNGKYGIVLWSSHGGRYGAVINTFDPNHPNIPDNVVTLEDYYPVHTFQASCQTGWPEDPNNLATSLLRHGAITTIAASRNGWGYSTEFKNGTFKIISEDSRKRSSQELALQYLKRFLMNESAGFSFARAIEKFSENEKKRNEIIFNLYGDPTLGITSWRESEDDSDHDGIIDEFDNCPYIPNPDQKDEDLDFVGNECDLCQGNYNPGAYDSDKDDIPDACDNCPNHYNPSQIDSDWDGRADACDNCPNHDNPNQEDSDGDGVGDICDNCPNKKKSTRNKQF